MKQITIYSECSKKLIINYVANSIKTYPKNINTKVLIDQDISKVEYNVKKVMDKNFIILTIYFSDKHLFNQSSDSYVKTTSPYSTEMFNIYLRLLRIVEENENDRLLQD